MVVVVVVAVKARDEVGLLNQPPSPPPPLDGPYLGVGLTSNWAVEGQRVNELVPEVLELAMAAEMQATWLALGHEVTKVHACDRVLAVVVKSQVRRLEHALLALGVKGLHLLAPSVVIDHGSTVEFWVNMHLSLIHI